MRYIIFVEHLTLIFVCMINILHIRTDLFMLHAKSPSLFTVEPVKTVYIYRRKGKRQTASVHWSCICAGRSRYAGDGQECYR